MERKVWVSLLMWAIVIGAITAFVHWVFHLDARAVYWGLAILMLAAVPYFILEWLISTKWRPPKD
jgi:hypothetical protein